MLTCNNLNVIFKYLFLRGGVCQDHTLKAGACAAGCPIKGDGSETHSALAQTNLRKKPAGAGDTLLGDERTISAQKGRDTQEEL